jgi:2',3'-cyclic-nucleotide 2'-phosphodiesterase (5'-nucleotidase family)
VKYIIDAERQNTSVIVVSSGDMFSGNPVIDNFDEKGYPMIDLMNKIGFDVAALGNHEFDYGAEVLKERMNQSTFPWICANVETKNLSFPQPSAYASIIIDDLKITFLGLIETAGSNYEIIPSSHPWKLEDFEFTRAQNVIENYKTLKEDKGSDLLIALSHLGYYSYYDNLGDFELAQQYSFIDAVIGGHSHAIIDTSFNNTPVFQAGSYLQYLGKIELSLKNRSIASVNYSLINLSTYSEFNEDLQAAIDNYNDWPDLYEVIGNSAQNHSMLETGCFYTDALVNYMNADVSFQNTGGIRALLYSGDITKRDIYEISPFNNGTVIYEMTISQIKEFLIGSGSGFYYSGITLNKVAGEIEIRDLQNKIIPNTSVLKVGINDYIPAVFPIYFPTNKEIQSLTAAETIIAYLESTSNTIDYSGYSNYFIF